MSKHRLTQHNSKLSDKSLNILMISVGMPFNMSLNLTERSRHSKIPISESTSKVALKTFFFFAFPLVSLSACRLHKVKEMRRQNTREWVKLY